MQGATAIGQPLLAANPFFRTLPRFMGVARIGLDAAELCSWGDGGPFIDGQAVWGCRVVLQNPTLFAQAGDFFGGVAQQAA